MTAFFNISLLAWFAAVQQPEQKLSLLYENDLFAQTDYYYTQGLRLRYETRKEIPVFRYFTPQLPHAIIQLSHISLRQDCYTPLLIADDTIRRGDRPYAGALYLEAGAESINEGAGYSLSGKLVLGILGAAAGGEGMQRTIHSAIGDVQPQGWKYQLADNPIINYELGLKKAVWSSGFAECLAAATARAGTFADDIALEAQLRAGFLQPYFYSTRRERLQLYLQGNAGTKVVGYNALLQGGLFAKSVYTIPMADVERLVGFASVRACISSAYFTLAYSQSWITREFNGGRPHAWGGVELAFRL